MVALAVAVGSIGNDPLNVLPWALLILTFDFVTGCLLMAGSLQGVGSSQPRVHRVQALTVTLVGAGIATPTVSDQTTYNWSPRESKRPMSSLA